MSKRSKYTAEEKLQILLEYENGSKTLSSICYTYQIAKSTFETWRYKYERYGIDGLKESKTWRQYSKELKGQAVLEYLSGQCSQREIIKKYEISDKSVLRNWLD